MNVVEVENLSFSYGDDINAIDDISFKIEMGAYTTIIGHNGSGKSTVAKLLIGLLEPLKGNIRIEGVPLSLENLDFIRSKVGIVFQNPDNQFIGSTVRDDIAFGLENHLVPQKDMDDIINKFSEKVKMKDFLNSEPSRLSGGQKQRVAIAGILAIAPDIIIFDEATSMLDPQGKDDIKSMIMELHNESKITIISITHDIEEVVKSDKVIVMNNGKIVSEGTPDKVMVDKKLLIDVGLDIPFSMKIVEELRKNKIKINDEVTMEGLVNKLANLI
ncbi:MAG: energy-coupling factor transporter ATPase [Erysipelotrichaceae bacterium]|nr:energy-coupling factor transporter ATPase [Erysipelotrichaceae bacterium]